MQISAIDGLTALEDCSIHVELSYTCLTSNPNAMFARGAQASKHLWSGIALDAAFRIAPLDSLPVTPLSMPFRINEKQTFTFHVPRNRSRHAPLCQSNDSHPVHIVVSCCP